jgi:hypothetical protein
MKLKPMFLVAAGVLAFAAANASAQNSVVISVGMAGSSALWLESGQAAASIAGLGCVYDSGSNKFFTLTDYRANFQNSTNNPSPTTDTGAGWVTWSSTTGTCAAPTGTITVNFYINTDSVVGQRCFFGVPRCYVTISSSASTVATGNPGKLISQNENALPSLIQSIISTNTGTITVGGSGKTVTGMPINAAATDIRPEDGRFAAIRAVETNCGASIGGSQYLGLGYANGVTPGVGVTVNGSTFQTSGGGSSFNQLDFNIGLNQADPILTTANNAGDNANGTVGPFSVVGVGAAPIVVFVNPSDETGFGSLQFTNLNRGTLAGYLDGTLGNTQDALASTATTNPNNGAVVFVREPYSGTYNTMEYSIPNSVELQTSQDVGAASHAAWLANGGTPGTLDGPNQGVFPPYYCNSNAAFTQTVSESVVRSTTKTSKRGRAIGTGNMVKSVTSTQNALGYAFWSAANFAFSTASPVGPTTAKYVTVDGVDPLQETWIDGLVPQTGNVAFPNTTLLHVRDGSYPVWSILRYVCDSSVGANNSCSAVNTLFNATQSFVSFGTDASQPDFVPLSSLPVRHSHFSPPTVTYQSSTNGNGTTAAGTPCNGITAQGGLETGENGGDVGGSVYNTLANIDYDGDNLVANNCGIVSRRQ